MDPLSVTASVVGLIGAAAKIYGVIEFLSSAKDAPATLREAQLEVKHTEMALRSLQRYISHLDQLDARRKQYIQLDELVVALTDAMLNFSEFENMLTLLARLTRLRVAISWFRYSKQINDHMVKTQRNKSTLILMMNVLRCESDIEALRSRDQLQISVEQILADNNDLRQKLSQMKDAFDAQSKFTRANTEMHTIRSRVNTETDTIRPHRLEHRDHQSWLSISTKSYRNSTIDQISPTGIFNAAFESILEKTWVYRRNRDGECDRSFIHSDLRSHAWSYLTGYSLADISTLSVISMPIVQVDLRNATYYNFGVVESYDGNDATQHGVASAVDGKNVHGNSFDGSGSHIISLENQAAQDCYLPSTDYDIYLALFMVRHLSLTLRDMDRLLGPSIEQQTGTYQDGGYQELQTIVSEAARIHANRGDNIEDGFQGT